MQMHSQYINNHCVCKRGDHPGRYEVKRNCMPTSWSEDGCIHVDATEDGARIIGTRCVCGLYLCNGGTAVSIPAPSTTSAPIIQCYQCYSEIDSDCYMERRRPFATTSSCNACSTFVGTLNGMRCNE